MDTINCQESNITSSMNQFIYIVGQPFPDNRYSDLKYGAVIDFKETTFDVNIFISDPTQADLTALRSGPFAYGLFERETIPFLSLEFQNLMFDCSFNILKLKENFTKQWLASRDNAMNIFVINSDNFQLMSIRSLGLHFAFIDELKNILSAQLLNFQNIHTVDDHIRKIAQKHSVVDINRLSKKFRIR